MVGKTSEEQEVVASEISAAFGGSEDEVCEAVVEIAARLIVQLVATPKAGSLDGVVAFYALHKHDRWADRARLSFPPSIKKVKSSL